MCHKYFQKGPISTKELQEYSKFGGWYVDFYGYVCTSSAEADWRKRDLVLQGFLLWTRSMAWPEHLHTRECLGKGLFFCSPDASEVQTRQAAGIGRSSASRRVCLDLNQQTPAGAPPTTCTPTGINFVVRNRHRIWGYAQHFSWPVSSVTWCTEPFFQKHDILKPSLKPRATLLLILALPWNAHLSLSIILSAYLPCLGFMRIQFCTLVLRCEGFHIGIEKKNKLKKKIQIR